MTGNAEGTRHAPGFPDLPTLRMFLAERYGVCDPSGLALKPLREHPRKRIYLVEREAGRENPAAPPLPWVLRVYGAGRPTGGVEAHAHVLQFLERHSYPAPRSVPATDGSAVGTFDAKSGQHPALVTTYVVGEPTRFALPGLRAH